jgi:outer membrane scaffolding protein for murein synthesis (MipA/OmpV family)
MRTRIAAPSAPWSDVLVSTAFGTLMLAFAASTAHGQQALHGTIGMGAATMPRYVGAEDSHIRPFPFIQLEYRDRAFAGVLPSGLGFGVGTHLVKREGFGLQVAISQANQRKERFGDALAGMGDRKAPATAGAAMTIRRGFLAATANAAAGLDGDVGSYGDVSLEASHAFGTRLMASVSTGVTVADERNMRYEFGVTEAQAATRQGLIDDGDTRLRDGDGEAYAPSAGLKQSIASASLAYAMSDRTRVLVFAQGSRLSDEATRSSLVRRRDGTSGGMAVVWGF